MKEIQEVRDRLSEVNVVSFSGGKDSSVVLSLVLQALAGHPWKLYIVTADTLMEIPYFQEYVNRVKDRIRSHIHESSLNAEVVTVSPDMRYSFWVSTLGKGYPAANMNFRWCTGHLKINPIEKFVKSATKDKGHSIFVGVRTAESALRAKIYKHKDYKKNHFAPILDWSSHDVWEFLLSQPCVWGGDHSELTRVYRFSSDECVYGEKQGVCVGNARYGCWACPLQTVAQLDMIGFNTGDDRYKKLKKFKTLLSACANNPECRSRIRRNMDVGSGPFLVEIRKHLFGELKSIESSTGWKLIQPEEEEMIRKHWEIDETIHNVTGSNQRSMFGVSTRFSVAGLSS